MNRSESKKKEKREAIKKAAFELFRERGYTDTRIIDIARRAGVAKGTVYEYYSGKIELMNMWIEHLQQAFASDAGELLQKMEENDWDYRILEESVRRNMDLVELNYKIIFDTEKLSDRQEQKEIRKNASNAFFQELGMTGAIIKEAVDKNYLRGVDNPNLVACILIMAVMMFHHIKGVHTVPDNDFGRSCYYESRDWTIRNLMDLLLNGVGTGNWKMPE